MGAPPAVAKVGLGSLLVVAVVSGTLSLGGAIGSFFFLSRRVSAASTESKPADTKPMAAPKTKQEPFEPMLVNLADSDGQSYLRLSVVLSVEDEAAKGGKAEKEKEKPDPKEAKGGGAGSPAARDAILGVVGAERSSDLLTPGGKDALKSKIRDAVQRRDPETKIVDVFFTEFLIQK